MFVNFIFGEITPLATKPQIKCLFTLFDRSQKKKILKNFLCGTDKPVYNNF